MMTITLKNVPEALHSRLKDRAARHKRSLNQELLACLEQAVAPAAREPGAILADLEGFRARAAAKPVSIEWILGAIEGGRR